MRMSPEEVWRRYDADEVRLSAPLSERMLDLAGVRPGMRVLDLASGRGEPAIRAAHRVGPSGVVVGLDPAEGMLSMASARAAWEGVGNVRWVARGAEWLPESGEPAFDAALCRWGLMYFEDPLGALGHVRRALRPGGRLVAGVWAEPERVPYHTWPRHLLARHAVLPEIVCGERGPFRYGAAGSLERDLLQAGYEVLSTEEREVAVMEAENVGELLDWMLAFGLARLLEGQPPQVRAAWEQDVAIGAEALRQNGRLRLGGVTRLVVAQRKADRP